MTTLENKLEAAVKASNLTTGIVETFANSVELANYLEVEAPKMSINQRVYLPVIDGEIIGISFKRGVAIRNLLDEAGVETLEELETL